MRLLLVEDEEGLVSALRIGLRREGYAVDVATTCADARARLGLHAYDLVILDVNLPDGDGFALAQEIRGEQIPCAAGPDVRVLMLTARGGLPDRVRGLDVGADDYVVKPFALAELSARIRALLRREVVQTSTVARFGDITLDPARQIVRRGDREVGLTLNEFAVLRYLMSKPEHLVSAEELLRHVWDENADPFTQTVRVTVGTLRRKLTVGSEPPAIETMVGRGYRLRKTA